MKRVILILMMSFLAIPSFAQDETEAGTEKSEPSFGIDLERECEIAEIEGIKYQKVVVELKAKDYPKQGVTVKMFNIYGKLIYKKHFSKSYLYGFSNGALQVGKGDILIQLILRKNSDGEWYMIIKEKGIY